MATTSYDSAFGYSATRINLVNGATNAVYVSTKPFQTTTSLWYSAATGGSLELIGAPLGTTYTAAQLATLNASGFGVIANTYLDLQGPASFYLNALGSTTTVFLLQGRSETN